MERRSYNEARSGGRGSCRASPDRGPDPARTVTSASALSRVEPTRLGSDRIVPSRSDENESTGGRSTTSARWKRSLTRRGALRFAAGTTLTAGLSSVGAIPVAAQSGPDFGGWFDDVDNYSGVVDRTGQQRVTVEVGAEGNGGPFAFAPPAIRVDPGTTVLFSWVSDTHNVVVQSQPSGAGWEGYEQIENTNFSFEHAFETEGIYTYYCEPHRGLGMKGAVVVGAGATGGGGGASGTGGGNATGNATTGNDTGGAGAADGNESAAGGGGGSGSVQPDFGSWLEGIDGGYEDARGQGEVTVQVGTEGNGGAFAFAPAGLWVDPGTTLIWEWTGEGGQHNVHAMEGASFESDLLQEAGSTFEHTFEESGIVEYQCDPHASLGMKGAVAVGDDVPTASAGAGGAGGGSGGGGPDGGGGGYSLPGDAFAQVLVPTAGSILGLAVLLAASPEIYDSIVRQYRIVTGKADRTAERTPTLEAPPERLARVIGHEEFDPVGTATLIVGYFAILALMWVFMYFVEFLGNGPTVIG